MAWACVASDGTQSFTGADQEYGRTETFGQDPVGFRDLASCGKKHPSGLSFTVQTDNPSDALKVK